VHPERFARSWTSAQHWSYLQDMTKTTPKHAGLELLRAIFDLLDADVRPTIRVLGRLTGQSEGRVTELMDWLRGRGLVAAEGVSLTMAGLVAASSLPEFEAVPAGAVPAGVPSRSSSPRAA
jgi:hypothetical protein